MSDDYFMKHGTQYPKQCRYCKYFKLGEQILTDNLTGITDSYDGYCNSGIVIGMVLVNTGCHCYAFKPRGD